MQNKGKKWFDDISIVVMIILYLIKWIDRITN